MKKLAVILMMVLGNVCLGQDQKVNRNSNFNEKIYLVNLDYSFVVGDPRVIKSYHYDREIQELFGNCVRVFAKGPRGDSMASRYPIEWKRLEGYTNLFKVFQKIGEVKNEIVIINTNLFGIVLSLYHKVIFYDKGKLISSVESLYIPRWDLFYDYEFRMNLKEWELKQSKEEK